MFQASKIEHQSQPTPMGCVCTCLAMLMGKPALDVIAKYHQRYFVDQTINGHDILREQGFIFEHKLAGSVETLHSGAVYMLTVASLNIQGGLHQILVDYREANAPRVLDPARGYGKRKYYTFDTNEVDEVPQACQLISWIVDYKITDRG